ncbi:MAG: P-loop NTPase [Acidobacteriota bacterium]
MNDRKQLQEPVVIPVAGGKGGVGKSILAANLAVALAQSGARVAAVDLDLGACNLFAFLGLPNRFPGIGDFLRARRGDLADLLVPTEVPGLSYLPGDGRTPFMANIQWAQKQRLLRALRRLPADYLVLDLGSGSNYNTLDYFSLGRKGMVVTTPDYPAVLNMLTFLKNFVLRRIEHELRDRSYLRERLREMYNQPMEEQITSLAQIRDEVLAEDEEARDVVDRICGEFRPRIVFNMGEHPDDLNLAEHIRESLATVLSIEPDFFGFVFHDPAVRRAVQARRPLLLEAPDSPAAEEIRRIGERVRKFWDVAIPDSAQLLRRRIEAVL